MKKLILCLILSFQVIEARAILFEPYIFTSYGEATHPNESESPKMFAHGVGASVLFSLIPMLSAGLSADYRLYSQMSDVKSPYGNRTGKRLAIHPTLGLKLGPAFFKYYYQAFGDYELDNETSSGEKLTYTDVSGHSFWLSFPVFPLTRVGVFYELEKYSKYENGSTEVDLSTSNNELEFNKFGIYLSILL
ncbi:hypothetical protein HBN50_12895 [Halobacteriovorax sp. GB3]|uniref:hypothetical protein n=1 Tax=Halobacteriovorax sp. GB3 TaxID=2719615 RepID=UPI0023627BFD|nr:hypothetical protein [Halobacteriovorax sp. GB3]MDD0854002.1 hypothetical protein [Halobacteriovorax sp. GB3]